MSKAKGNNSTVKEGKLSKIIKSPVRALIKLKDLYVQSMTECSGQFDVGMAMGCPAPTLPRSFSSGAGRASDADYRELVRAASARSAAHKPGLDFSPKPSPNNKQFTPSAVAPALSKSRSAAITRIDEDKPCDFDVCPRSRSYAVNRRKMV